LKKNKPQMRVIPGQVVRRGSGPGKKPIDKKSLRVGP